MDRSRVFDPAQAKIDAFERPFDGRERTPAFPSENPAWHFKAGALHGRPHERWDPGRDRIPATQVNRQRCQSKGQQRDVHAWRKVDALSGGWVNGLVERRFLEPGLILLGQIADGTTKV